MHKMKYTIKELAQTGSSDVQGTTVGTKYGLQPIEYLKEIIDAAKSQLFFANFVRVMNAPQGIHDVVIPVKSTYKGSTGVSFDTTERTSADISWTTLDNLKSIIATPSPVMAGFALTKYALRTNALNLLEIAKEELSYAIGERLDKAIAVAMGDAIGASSSATGAQILFGGDATSDSTLASGDVLTTDLIAKAAKLLKSKNKEYRTNNGAGGGYGSVAGHVTGNPWMNTPDDPYVLFIGPAQEEVLRKDSQFTNAAEYGSDVVVQNGEIGQYLGIRVVVTNNVEQVSAGSEGPDPETANVAVDMTRCILCKPKHACAVVWGRQPELNSWEYNERDQVRISLVCEYDVKVIYPDAIVFIDVADA